MNRYIIVDTETTGLYQEKDRVFEIAGVEIIDGKVTGKEYHSYINPKIELSNETKVICKIDDDSFLADEKEFSEIIDDFLNFLGDDAIIVAHNAAFDVKFINAEMERCAKGSLAKYKVVDTVRLFKFISPNLSAKLDHICSRMNIDLSIRDRDGHSAIVDCRLLAEAFCLAIEGKDEDYPLNFDQREMDFVGFSKNKEVFNDRNIVSVSEAEEESHKRMMSKIMKK